MRTFWIRLGQVVGFVVDEGLKTLIIGAVLWAFGIHSWKAALLSAFAISLYLIGLRHGGKLLSGVVLRSAHKLFGAPPKEVKPAYGMGDMLVFDHTSTGLSAESGYVIGVFSSGQVAFEMGIEKTAFEVGWVRPGPYYAVTILGGNEEEDKGAFVVLPESMLRLLGARFDSSARNGE